MHPLLAAATPAGVVPFLEALLRPLSVCFFEHQGKPYVRFSGFGQRRRLSLVLLCEDVVLFARGVLGSGSGDIGRLLVGLGCFSGWPSSCWSRLLLRMASLAVFSVFG
ncbi:hypothetical protein VPH35_012810 [Triticum aestivum]